MARGPLCLILVLAMLAVGRGLDLAAGECPPNVDCDSKLLTAIRRRLNIGGYQLKDMESRREDGLDAMETGREAGTPGIQTRHEDTETEAPSAAGSPVSVSGLSSGNLKTARESSLLEFVLLEYLREIVKTKTQQNREISNMKGQITDLRGRLDDLTASGHPGTGGHVTSSPPRGSGGGGLYTIWGRTTCPGNGTETVYSGQAGGGHYAHSGSAAEYVCLPLDPQWAHYDDAHIAQGLMYGAEYEDGDRGTLHFGNRKHNLDVPCAVCRVASRPTVLMIPARKQCYDGWHQEYTGYLMTGHHTHPAASQYVCVDGQPEALHTSVGDHDGKLFYFVEGQCGSLKCPPYVNNRELTCVVCSK